MTVSHEGFQKSNANNELYGLIMKNKAKTAKIRFFGLLAIPYVHFDS